jgi:hypothetical protein
MAELDRLREIGVDRAVYLPIRPLSAAKVM